MSPWQLVRCSSSVTEMNLLNWVISVTWRMEATQFGLLAVWISKPMEISALLWLTAIPSRQRNSKIHGEQLLLLLDCFSKLSPSSPISGCWYSVFIDARQREAMTISDIKCLASSRRVVCYFFCELLINTCTLEYGCSTFLVL